MALLGAQFVNAVSPSPVGVIEAYAGASAPSGWLLCNGAETLISTYPELYSVLGTTYGSLTNGSGGAGSTHFRVPDLRGRTLVGLGTHADVNALGKNEGITSANVANRRPKHQHTVYDPGHTHSSARYQVAGTTSIAGGGSAYPISNFATGASATGIQVNPGGVASDTTSPQDAPAFLVTNYIIKAVPDAPRSGLAYGSTPPIASTFPANPQFGEVVSFSINNGTQLVPCQWTGSRWCALVGGGPIQVVQVVKTDAMAAAPNALWGDIPGLAATITPIFNTSKVLVTVDLKGAGAQSSSVMSVRLLRDSTPVFIGDAASNRRRAMSQEYNGNTAGDSNFAMAQMGGTFLDSPATTSAITYKVQFGGDSSGSVLYVNRTQGDRDNANMDARGASSITLMEMAA